MTTNILVADDHPIVRQGFIKIIEADEAFHITAQTGDGKEALALIRRHKPDVAVLDISMPGMNGIDIVKELQEEGCPTRLVILTMYKDREYFDEAMALGVKGYILKESAIHDLLACLRAVVKDDYYISPTISGYLVQKPARTEDNHPLAGLTAGEREVLKRIAENKTSKQIADELFVSYRTVQNHRANICRKLGLKGPNKLLEFAIESRGAF